MHKYCASGLSMAVFVVALAGCEPTAQVQELEIDENGNVVEVEPQPENPAEAAKSGDEEVTKELLADKETYAEAKDWLSPKHANHALWKGDREAIVKVIDELYEAGAVKVYAVGFEKDDNPQIVAQFVAELPTDAAARKKVFDTHNKFWKKYLSGEDEEELKSFMEKDNGQKYIVLNFDL
jgi:hypothetical protein